MPSRWICESCAALTGTKDQKHQEGGSDNANDDEDQSRAGEARSLLRWWSRRFHLRLDADCGLGGGFGKELPHGAGYFFEVGFESEVACIQKLDDGVGVIACIGFCAWRNEEPVVLAPDRGIETMMWGSHAGGARRAHPPGGFAGRRR